jgi:hypothetical protein
METQNKECVRIQDILINMEDSIYDSDVLQHLESCIICQEFAKGMSTIKKSYSENQDIQPNPEIKEKLITYMQNREKRQNNILPWIKKTLTYRIPAYQVAAVAAVFLIIFFAAENMTDLDQTFYSSGTTDILPQDPEFSQINLMDSLNLSGLQNIGRNALEDSAITKFLVGTL